MASSPQKNLQFISPPKEVGDFLQNQVKKMCYTDSVHSLRTDKDNDCAVFGLPSLSFFLYHKGGLMYLLIDNYDSFTYSRRD